MIYMSFASVSNVTCFVMNGRVLDLIKGEGISCSLGAYTKTASS